MFNVVVCVVRVCYYAHFISLDALTVSHKKEGHSAPLLRTPMTVLISSYVPQESAVEGTLMHMRGPTPFAKALNPSR